MPIIRTVILACVIAVFALDAFAADPIPTPPFYRKRADPTGIVQITKAPTCVPSGATPPVCIGDLHGAVILTNCVTSRVPGSPTATTSVWDHVAQCDGAGNWVQVQ